MLFCLKFVIIVKRITEDNRGSVVRTEKWLSENTEDLSGKTVAITGSTGGLGRALCAHFARLGASLVLVDRNRKRSEALKKELLGAREGMSVRCISADMEDIRAVEAACLLLEQMEIDILVLNAGAYSIVRRKCEGGYDNVFQINFISPYYMARRLLPSLSKRGGRVIAVGSIAHTYSHIDEKDIDFSKRSASSKVYGNAKRHLMFSLFELFKGEKEASLAIAHPGITFTNITSHYPKLIFAIIKYPMKVIFMPTARASLSVLRGAFESTDRCEWIGPRIFDVWGMPKKRRLSSCCEAEIEIISRRADKIYNEMRDITKKLGT